MISVRYLFIVTMCFSSFFCVAQKNDDAINALNGAILHKPEFTFEKEEKIESLKKIRVPINLLTEQYQINKALYQEYQKFKIDSAVFYVAQNLSIAKEIRRNDLQLESEFQLAYVYSSLDKFFEAKDILNTINKDTLSKPGLINYYEAQLQFFDHYVTNSYSKTYLHLIGNYRDSLLALLPPSSLEYKINLAQKDIYSGHFKNAEQSLLAMIPVTKSHYADYAMVTYLLGYSYGLEHKTNVAINYYALSAATDVQNANKDNASIEDLALICYQTGDIDLANTYTQSAIEDAIFCNAKFRTLHMSELYTIINFAYLKKETKSKSELKLFLLMISILSFFLIAAVLYVYKQMKRVSKIKEQLDLTGKQLSILNKEINDKNKHLNNVNGELLEANKVKEIYIAQFFDLCSTYINKLEDYRKTLNKKAHDKQLDELFKMLRSTQLVHDEAEELYKIFDNIFLNLYPNFIFEFNALLIPEERIMVKQGELLNTELRIYALIRLGITDSVKIASFLRYSLSTIYNYRTGARNKAVVSRDAFEELVKKIGNIDFKP